jgi:hypothetical protein
MTPTLVRPAALLIGAKKNSTVKEESKILLKFQDADGSIFKMPCYPWQTVEQVSRNLWDLRFSNNQGSLTPGWDGDDSWDSPDSPIADSVPAWAGFNNGPADWETIDDSDHGMGIACSAPLFGDMTFDEVEREECDRQRLFFQGQRLKGDRTVKGYKLRSGNTVFVMDKSRGHVQLMPGSVVSPQLEEIIANAEQGLANGATPQLTASGLGGTYFLRSEDGEKVIGVFKPETQEAGAPGNPRGHAGRMGSRGVRPGLLSGEANVREVAAYMLDHGEFAHVPCTARVLINHSVFGCDSPVVGSLQEFKEHDDEVCGSVAWRCSVWLIAAAAWLCNSS